MKFFLQIIALIVVVQLGMVSYYQYQYNIQLIEEHPEDFGKSDTDSNILELDDFITAAKLVVKPLSVPGQEPKFAYQSICQQHYSEIVPPPPKTA